LTIGYFSAYVIGEFSKPGSGMNTETLLNLAESYAAHRGLTLSTVSTYAATDGKFFPQLKSGASCTLRRAARVLAWFSENWPADLEWPRDIPRPDPRKKKEVA